MLIRLAPLLGAIALALPAGAQCPEGEVLPTGPDPTFGALGVDVDVEGDLLIAGADRDAELVAAGGAAYVVEADTGTTRYKLLPGDPTPWKRFGSAVAIEGAFALIGAPSDDEAGPDAGAVYLFDVVTGAQLAKWLPPGPSASFGRSVDLSGGVAIVGSEASEAVLINVPSGSVRHVLTASNPGLGDLFGWYTCIDGNHAVVSAASADRNAYDSGTAYVFDVTTGAELGELPTDAGAFAYFGSRCNASQGRVALSAHDGVRVFDLATRNLVLQLHGSGTPKPTVLHGDTLALAHPDNLSGGFLFLVDVPTGATQATITDASGHPNDGFGSGLAMNDERIYVGAPGNDEAGGLAGKLGIFDRCDEVGLAYCTPAVPNSTGWPAQLTAFGSDLAAEQQLHLRAKLVPDGEFGYFLTSQTQGFVSGPGGSQGDLCLGGTIARFSGHVLVSNQKRLEYTVDLGAIPTSPPHQVQPGETWNFQAWFRDGTTSNFTDAVSITYQ